MKRNMKDLPFLFVLSYHFYLIKVFPGYKNVSILHFSSKFLQSALNSNYEFPNNPLVYQFSHGFFHFISIALISCILSITILFLPINIVSISTQFLNCFRSFSSFASSVYCRAHLSN